MDDDDYFVDRYDCPSSSPKMDETGNSDSLVNSLNIVSKITDTFEDDEPYEYDDDYDQLVYSNAATIPDNAQFHSLVDGAEEYLREIWSQLNVGHNGYLTVSELYIVCEHIGMSVASEEMIQQLFDKLDNDQDGRVSFSEFVDGLFKYVHHQYQDNNCQQLLKDHQQTFNSITNTFEEYCDETLDKNLMKKNAPISSYQLALSVSGQSSKISSTIDPYTYQTGEPLFSNILSSYSNFLTIKSDKDGYTNATTLINLWESLGIEQNETTTHANDDDLSTSIKKENLRSILKHFDLSTNAHLNNHHYQQHFTERIQTSKLWTRMRDVLIHNCDSILYQVSLATILNEFSQLKNQYDQTVTKCDRLEINLQQASCRAELLAQEVDEQHQRIESASECKLALLEKKYQDQIRLLEMDFSQEKESLMIQTCHLRQDIDKQINTVQEQLTKFRLTVKMLEKENKRLESECQLIKYENNELERNFSEIQKQIQESDHLHYKIAELESLQLAKDQENLEQLRKEIENLKEQNKKLQDQNDELLIEKDSLRQQLASFVVLCQQHQPNQSSIIWQSPLNQTSTLTSSNGSPKASIPDLIMQPGYDLIRKLMADNMSSVFNKIGSNKKRKRRRRRKKKNKSKEEEEEEEEEEREPTNKSDFVADQSTVSSMQAPLQEKTMDNKSEWFDDDRLSTITITTQEDYFDDDDDDYECKNNRFWNNTNQHKRVKPKPDINSKLKEWQNTNNHPYLDDNEDDEDNNENDDDLHIPKYSCHSYGRSLSEEINFEQSRPVYATNFDTLENSLEQTIRKIVKKCCQKEVLLKENGSKILEQTLKKILQSLEELDGDNEANFDQNNNPN